LSEMLAGNKRVCLLTGGPGVGKTTIIQRALDRTRVSAGGFFTEEIRSVGVRQGFKIVTLDGESATLSHTGIRSPYRVGKYGVDIEALERVGVAAIREAARGHEMVVIDEIGKMELYSKTFREAVEEAINSGKRVLGTIVLSSHPWADKLKRFPDVTNVVVTRSNRDSVLEQVVRWIEHQ
jgi:nucleoside-triphosphatase